MSSTLREDNEEVTGEVTRADVVARRFVVRTPDGRSLEAPFDPVDEHRVTEALRDHDERRVVVHGRVLRDPSGRLVRFLSVTRIQFVDQTKVVAPITIWDRLLELADDAVEGAPSDLASRLDDYLYRPERD